MKPEAQEDLAAQIVQALFTGLRDHVVHSMNRGDAEQIVRAALRETLEELASVREECRVADEVYIEARMQLEAAEAELATLRTAREQPPVADAEVRPPQPQDGKLLRTILRTRIYGLVNRGAEVCAEFQIDDNRVTCVRCGYMPDVHLLRDCLKYFEAEGVAPPPAPPPRRHRNEIAVV